MIYFVSRQRVSVKDGKTIKNARRRMMGNIMADCHEEAIEKFISEYSDLHDDKFRYELTDGQWRHISYIQQGEVT